VSIDDRIRAATEATAATVREIPPLILPGTAPPARPRRRRSRRARPGGATRPTGRGRRGRGT